MLSRNRPKTLSSFNELLAIIMDFRVELPGDYIIARTKIPSFNDHNLSRNCQNT